MTGHPYDPLTADEITTAVAAVLTTRTELTEPRFPLVRTDLPAKETLRAPHDNPERAALLVVYDRADAATYEATVHLASSTVTAWRHVPGVQPAIMIEEIMELDAIVRKSPEAVAALARHGVTDLDLLQIDPWSTGTLPVPGVDASRRIVRASAYVREFPQDNGYARPVGNLVFVVDCNDRSVVAIEEGEPVPLPPESGNYDVGSVGPLRTDLRPLEITQPEGPSFTLDGNLLRWQNWSLRVGFNYREGMTLHTVRYRDGDRDRSIAHRMSFAEMVVPYRDPSVDHYRRTAFDIGEWGLGFMTQSLELGCDCLGEIRYLDAVLHDSAGEPYTITNAICIHEEDDAILWKHVDHDAGAEVRRARRLVVSFHVTVANYEYLAYWRFYQDGNIECEVRATGIMVTTPLVAGQPHPNGTLVDERTYAPFHQHFLVARLDLDVDGSDNTVFASESYAEPMGPDNPQGLSVVVRNTPLRTESEGKQDVDFATQRAWKVVNTNVVNGLGTHPSYKLVPTGAIPPMFDPQSPVFKRANVIGHTLWVTPNRPDERWPAGEFVNQSAEDSGLAVWTAADRPIENTDVVLWYVFGLHHVTRPEDWPVMPVDVVSFWLKPYGFFDRNPSLDVAPSPSDHCDPAGS